jgi:hypothetical protein
VRNGSACEQRGPCSGQRRVTHGGAWGRAVWQALRVCSVQRWVAHVCVCGWVGGGTAWGCVAHGTHGTRMLASHSRPLRFTWVALLTVVDEERQRGRDGTGETRRPTQAGAGREAGFKMAERVR